MKEDLQDQAENSLIEPMGECTPQLLNLVMFGKATPYLHNGTITMEDEHGEVTNNKESLSIFVNEKKKMDLCTSIS
jgi:hypothetical protein